MKQYLVNDNVKIEYNPDSKYPIGYFTGDDMTDRNNYPCFYSKTMRTHKAAWAALVKAWTPEIKMYDAIDILYLFGIRCHSYCAMD